MFTKAWATATGLFAGGFGLVKAKRYIGIGFKIWQNKDIISKATKAWDEINDIPADLKNLRNEVKAALKDKNMTKEETDKVLMATKHLVDEVEEAYAATLPVIKQLKEIVK